MPAVSQVIVTTKQLESGVIESFEDSDWDSDYSSTAGSITRVQSPGPIGGDWTAEQSAGGFDNIDSPSGSGLPNYPAKGDIIRVYFRSGSGSDGKIYAQFGLGASEDNCYELEFAPEHTRFRLFNKSGGSRSTVATDNNVTYSANTWYEGIIEWDDGTLGGSDNDIRAELRDFDADSNVTNISGNDSEHSGQTGVGWIFNAPSSDKQWIEHYHIENLLLVDSWEDGDIAEYSVQVGNWDVVDEANVTPDARHGSNMLRAPSDGATDPSELFSVDGDGLDYYPVKGDVIKCLGQTDTDDLGMNIFFFGCDANSPSDTHYELRVDHKFGNLIINETSGGTVNKLQEKNIDTDPDTWYRVRIEWDDGTLGGSDNDIRVFLVDGTTEEVVATLDVNDSTHATSSGIGFKAKNQDEGATLFFDYSHAEV